MEKLTELEHSVAELSKDEYTKFRDWFWDYENQKWDEEIEADVKGGKLKSLTDKALTDFAKGNFKKL